MTIDTLKQYRHLKRELANQRERLIEICDIGIPTGFSGIRSSGISDRVGNQATRMADVRECFEHNIARCAFELNRILRYVEKVSDSYIRELFRLRFIDGYSWLQVAQKSGGAGDGSTERKCVLRYIEREAAQ